MKKKLSINKIIGYPRLNEVWHRLLKILPNEYHDMNLNIAIHNWGDYELLKGGYAEKSVINIGAKFLNKYKNDRSMLVCMLAHELGHHILGHMHSYSERKEQEQDADQFGLLLAMQAGFNPKMHLKKTKEFEAWRASGIQKSHKKSHGDAEDRIKKLNNQLKYLGIIK